MASPDWRGVLTTIGGAMLILTNGYLGLMYYHTQAPHEGAARQRDVDRLFHTINGFRNEMRTDIRDIHTDIKAMIRSKQTNSDDKIGPMAQNGDDD